MPSLTLANSLRATITYSPFSPASLFSGGAPGVWYDPSDYTTLFQDSAGTTPVTAVEQPVGLMLDKSQGLVLGPELVADYTTGYTASGTANVTVSAGEVIATADGSSATPGYYYAITTVVGQQYYVTGVLRSPTTNTMYLGANSSTSMGSNINRASSFSASSTQVGFFFTAVGTTTYIFVYGSTGTVGNAYAGRNISVKYRPGNHAFQSTSASRPVLSARYNLLTKTEQFNDAVWAKSNGSISANATVAPDGTTTADAFNGNGVSTFHTVEISGGITLTSGVSYTYSVRVKANVLSLVQLASNAGVASGAQRANFDLSAGTVGTFDTADASITSLGSGWYKCSITVTANSTAAKNVYLALTNSTTASFAPSFATSDGIFIWGADLRVSNNGTTQPAYQRVNTSTDYNTTGFLPYLKFDGVDDSMSTNSINFTSTDKMSVFAGVRKLSDAARAVAVDLSASPFINAGSFGVELPNDATGTRAFFLNGSQLGQFYTAPATAPKTEVLSISYDIGNAVYTTEIVPRSNGSILTATSGVAAGTGNFGNYPLFIGRRNNASLPFNGQLYSMTIVGKQVTATELSSTETYTAIKTGVTLA